jgi:hypothetical protein
LEYLEDKLREYRFLKQSNSEQRAVLLGQLDGVRRELLEVLASSAPRIMFAKEIVREVLNFACAGDDTPRSGASPSQTSSRLPSSREKAGRNNNPAPVAESSLFSIMTSSPKPSLPSGQPSYGSLHENDLWDSSNNNHRRGGGKPIAAANGNDDMAMPVPGATTTSSRPRGIHHTSTGTTHHQHESIKDRSRRYGSSSTSAATTTITTHHHITDEDIYGPAPIIGGGSGSGSKKTNISSPGGTSAGIGNAATIGGGGASGSTSDANRPGGMLKIREMLSRAEKGLSAVAETKEQRRAPPRILGGEGNTNDLRGYGTEDWDGISPSGYNTPPPEFDGEHTMSVADGSHPWAPSGHPGFSSPAAAASNKSYSVRDWTIKAEPNSASQFTPRSATGTMATDGGADTSSTGGAHGNSSGLPGLVGKLAGFAFLLGSIAAATMAATGTLPGSHNKHDSSTTTTTNSARNRARESTARSTSSQQRQGATSRRSHGAGAADVPPWKDATSNTATSGAGGVRRKASSGRAGKSSGTSRNGTSSTYHQQGPVMHVHQPPSSGSFPTVTPPDVTAAMG